MNVGWTLLYPFPIAGMQVVFDQLRGYLRVANPENDASKFPEEAETSLLMLGEF